MKISLNWINEFVDIADYFQKPEQLAQVLTQAGLEVESIQNRARDFAHIVIGLILEKAQHPDAQKLSVCQVSTGQGVVHQIVCGAQNHKAEDRVIVALPGAQLPSGIAIKTSVLRGVESAGMLCSYSELGLKNSNSQEEAGIALLPDSAPIGASFADYAGLSDIFFELKVTPNRADCLSHMGLAREIACLLSRPFRMPSFDFESLLKSSWPDALQLESLGKGETFSCGSHLLSVDRELAQVYAGLLIHEVSVGPSPVWLAERLAALGFNSINSIVDITNWVMLEWGQPLHAFDYDELKGGRIAVKKAEMGHTFTTLDGTVLELKGVEPMIYAGDVPVCMAGVIGGKNSGTTLKTQNIFLESAAFSAASVRKASRLHGIQTESAYRFARGVDPHQSLLALKRAAFLIKKYASSTSSKPEGKEGVGQVMVASSVEGESAPRLGELSLVCYGQEGVRKPILLSLASLSDRLGFPAEEAKFENFMLRLGCQLKREKDGGYELVPPSWRFDLETDMDLVEEYARLAGYDLIPETLPPFRVMPKKSSEPYAFQMALSRILVGQGFYETRSFAFTSKKISQDFLLPNGERPFGLKGVKVPIKVLNPINEDQDLMRPLLLPLLFESVVRNQHHGVLSGRLFECGPIFFTDENKKYLEEEHLAMVLWGQGASGLWQDERVPLVMQIKKAAEVLMNSLGIGLGQLVFSPLAREEAAEFMHWGRAASIGIRDGQEVLHLGFLAALHPSYLEKYKLREDMAFLEIRTDQLRRISLQRNQLLGENRIKNPSAFPAVERDLTLILEDAVLASDVEACIQDLKLEHLTRAECIKLFKGESLPAHKKAMTLRFRFQSESSTLTDQDVNFATQKITEHLLEKLSASMR